MSKRLAAFYGQRSMNRRSVPQPQEYTVLGINQPLIAPEVEPAPASVVQSPSILHGQRDGQRKFRLSLLLNKLL